MPRIKRPVRRRLRHGLPGFQVAPDAHRGYKGLLHSAGLPGVGMISTGHHFRTLSHREITMDIIRILLAIILPPLGVFLQVGIGLHFWINILLTLLGYVPGIIHAIWVIVKK